MVLRVETLWDDPSEHRDALHSAVETANALLEALRRQTQDLRERLRTANRERAVARQEISRLRDALFQMRRKRQEVEARLNFHGPKFEHLKSAHEALATRKESLDAKIGELKTQIAWNEIRTRDLEREIQELNTYSDDLEEAIRSLNSTVSVHLGVISLDKDDSLAEVNRLVQLSNELKKNIKEVESTCSGYRLGRLSDLEDEIFRLESEIARAEKIKTLCEGIAVVREELKNKSSESAALSGRLEGGRARLASRRETMERLRQETQDSNAALSGLEREVEAYMLARVMLQSATAEHANSLNQLGDSNATLHDAIAGQVRLESEFSGLHELVKTIVSLLPSVQPEPGASASQTA